MLLLLQITHIALAASDTTSLSASDASAVSSGNAVSDSASSSLNESVALASTTALTDTASLSVTENAALYIEAAVAASDTADVSVDDVSALETFNALEASDDAGLSLSETSSVQQSATQQETETFTGGFFVSFEREMERRRRERRKRQEDEEEAQRIAEDRDRQIAAFLHEQEAKDAERDELARLGSLVTQFADSQAQVAFNERVAKAFARALAQQNASALLALEREVGRQMEEEEFAVLMALALDD